MSRDLPGWYRWVDNASIQVRFVEHASAAPQEVWHFQIASGDEVDLDDMALEVVEAANVVREGGPFAIATRRSHISWGASGGGWAITLDLSLAIAAGAAGEQLRIALVDLVRRASQRANTNAMSAGEACGRARWILAQEFGGADDEYVLVSEEEFRETHRWVLGFIDGQRIRYEVEIGLVEDLPWTYRVRRERAADGA